MKIRLQIETPDGTTTFEHAGPVVRVGRDPECELQIQGKAAEVVSRQHARLELAANRATVADAGSSNGTLLNGRLLKTPAPLRVGSEIQLGQTGVTIRVLALDAAPSQSFRAAPVLIGLGSLAAAALVVVAIAWLVTQNGRCQETGSEPLAQGATSQSASPTAVPTGSATTPVTKPTPPPVLDPGKRDPLSSPPPPPPPPPSKTKPEAQEVGTYAALPEWGPGVLLRREGEAFPWVPLRPEERVSTEQTLISLPGYRSAVSLDSGVWLTLWGNVPEFSSAPPVLESVVVLNKPAADEALDVTLERGRIVLTNVKAKPARIRLRFLAEDWLLTLAPGKEGEIAIELWIPPQRHASADPRTALRYLGLFTRGGGGIVTPQQRLDLTGMARLVYVSQPRSLLPATTLTALPEWLTQPPDPKTNKQVADAMLSLKDWAGYLARSADVIDTIRSRIDGSADAMERSVGVLFLGSLDGVRSLADLLHDKAHPAVRGAAGQCLRTWLVRFPGQAGELHRILRDKGYSLPKADLIVELLQPLPREKLVQANTFKELIDHLDHEDLVVRDLAFWHLVQLVPRGGKEIAYNPAEEPARRQKGIAEWKVLLFQGKVLEELKAALAGP